MTNFLQTPLLDLEPGTHKFIIYREGDDIKIKSRDLPRHNTIYATIQNNINESDVLGGGKMKLDLENHIIKVWGKSTVYGKFDTDMIGNLLGHELDGRVIGVE